MESVSLDEARRIALAAQGFDTPRPSRAGPQRIRAVLDRLSVLQLDSVNVLCRSHYLPLFSRLGPYRRELLDQMAWGQPRELFEYWGHQASLMPLTLHPLLRWRMQAAQNWTWDGWTSATKPGQPPADWARTWDARIHAPWAVTVGMTRLTLERPAILDEVLEQVRRHGPVLADDAAPTVVRRGREDPDPDPSTGRMWNWQDGKIAIEWLFCTGAVTTATRRSFTRLYDLTERVLPKETLAVDTPEEADARRELMRRAGRAVGIGSEKQLRNYFLMPRALARIAIEELIESGELIKVRIDGVRGVRYRWHETEPSTGSSRTRTLLSPFDPLIWDRDRIEQLFGFRYRISIYTRESERTDGYYVLPFLSGGSFVARVDLRAERDRSALVVPTVSSEPGHDPDTLAAELAVELRSMADWLGLEQVVVGRRGNLAAALKKECR